MIGSQRFVYQFTSKMEKLSKHHGNYGIHLDASSKLVNDIFQDNLRDEELTSVNILTSEGKLNFWLLCRSA